jgi:hypothetical protein
MLPVNYIKKLRLFDMPIIFYITLLCLLSNTSIADSNGMHARFSVIGSSEPVSIDDMVNGWDGGYQRGELAYADIAWDLGYTKYLKVGSEDYGSFRISRGHRIYYYLKFDKETADFYRAQELRQGLSENKTLDLEVKYFESPTVSFSYVSPKVDLSLYDIQPIFSISANLYQPGHRQFGEIKGIAYKGGDANNFSANIDYRYDQFKLPWLEAERGFHTDKGQGYSLDLGVTLDKNNWLLNLEAKDLLAHFYWAASGVTVACLQTEGGAGAVCNNNGGNGKSEVKPVSETIPVSFTGLLKHKGYDVSVHAFQHDTYRRFGLEKGIETELGRFAFLLYYPQLVGVSWQTSIFNVQLGADTPEFSQARNVQLNMGFNWRW